jgi:5-methylcytosine-specific restriction endonuclease McrA
MVSKLKTKPASTKLPSGTTARSVKEWVGKSPDDWPPPPRVQLRILERQRGKCAITGSKFVVGDKKQMDHKIPQADGGENRESNVHWILTVAAHHPKTKAEAAVRKKVRAKAKKHAGIKRVTKRPLESRNNLQAASPDQKRLPTPSHLPSQIERLYALRPIVRGKR